MCIRARAFIMKTKAASTSERYRKNDTINHDIMYNYRMCVCVCVCVRARVRSSACVCAYIQILFDWDIAV